MRRMAALGGEQSVIENWQFKRNGSRRNSVEVSYMIANDSELHVTLERFARMQ